VGLAAAASVDSKMGYGHLSLSILDGNSEFAT